MKTKKFWQLIEVLFGLWFTACAGLCPFAFGMMTLKYSSGALGYLIALGCGLASAWCISWTPRYVQELKQSLNLLFSKASSDSEDQQIDATSSNEGKPEDD